MLQNFVLNKLNVMTSLRQTKQGKTKENKVTQNMAKQNERKKKQVKDNKEFGIKQNH